MGLTIYQWNGSGASVFEKQKVEHTNKYFILKLAKILCVFLPLDTIRKCVETIRIRPPQTMFKGQLLKEFLERHYWLPIQWRTGVPASLALARWASWSAGQVGRHVKC